MQTRNVLRSCVIAWAGAALLTLVAAPADGETFRIRVRQDGELIAPPREAPGVAPELRLLGPQPYDAYDALRVEPAPYPSFEPAAPLEAYGPGYSISPAICHAPKLVYRDHVGRRSRFAHGPRVDLVLETSSPCGCCTVEIPVCIPACCTGVPCVSARDGLFKREIIDYSWDCGFRVRVIFNRHGDAVVHYLD